MQKEQTHIDMVNSSILKHFYVHYPHIKCSADYEQVIPSLFKQIIKESKFCNKLALMAQDVEGSKELPPLSDCWRWIKGLLYDFIQLKKENHKLNKRQ